MKKVMNLARFELSADPITSSIELIALVTVVLMVLFAA